MDEIINKIIEHNKELFGDDSNVEKNNVGFTNAIYKVNNSFIVKICNDIDNEDRFKKEIDFYKVNATNNLIPKLFYSNTEKLEFDKYIESDEFVLIHNDLHFDNILVNDGKIKVIDFERSMYAPKDFELHILYYMIRQPWKHANEECEKYTKVEDYKNIMGYIEKYYPEIINIPNLYKRLAIYDLIYEFSHFVKFPNHYDELKEAVMTAAKRII